MNLRAKTLLSVVLGLVVLVAGLSAVVRAVILGGFGRVESDSVRDSIQRAQNALAVDVETLRSTTTDYAQWDDTYSFMKTGDASFIDDNLNPDTFERLRIGFVLFEGTDGRVTKRIGYDLQKGALQPLPGELVEALTTDAALAMRIRRQRGAGGIVRARGELWLFAAQPVLQSDSSGPSRGTLYVGRAFDVPEIQRLAQTTHLSLQVRDLDATAQRDRSPGRTIVRPLGPARIAGFAPMRDWNDRPVAILQATSARPVYAHGREVWDLVFVGLLVVAAFVGATTLFLLERVVIARLREVISVAAHVADSGDLSSRVPVRSNDELSTVARTLNGMLGDLERTQVELRDNEKRWRRLVELLPDAVIVHADGAVLLANPAACRMLGVATEADLLGQPVSRLVETSVEAGASAASTSSVRGPGALAGRLRALDGSTTEVELREVPFTALGRAAVQLIAHDVTEHRRLESQLRQNQKMEALGRLAGGIAHDFNNLVTIIGAHSEILIDELPEGDMQESAAEIRKAGQRASSLTRQLLAFSRKQVLQPRILDLNVVLADVDKMLRRLIGEDIELVTHACSDPWRVRADAGQVEQVLMNLAVNARDAMPKGGRLVIETTNELITTDGDIPRGSWVRLMVRDSGIGMDDATQARVFEPFYTTKAQGTGLGLSTVFGVVQQSGGRIRLRSRPGQGASFEIYFPRAEGTQSDAPSVVPAITRGQELILVIEDEDALRRVVCGILQRSGYRVVQAPNGREAMEVWKAHAAEIDLILSDVVMPSLGGPDFKRWLDTQQEGETRTIFMSGYTNSEKFDEVLEEAHAEFLQKPFTPDELARRVREVLDRPSTLPH